MKYNFLVFLIAGFPLYGTLAVRSTQDARLDAMIQYYTVKGWKNYNIIYVFYYNFHFYTTLSYDRLLNPWWYRTQNEVISPGLSNAILNI